MVSGVQNLSMRTRNSGTEVALYVYSVVFIRGLKAAEQNSFPHSGEDIAEKTVWR